MARCLGHPYLRLTTISCLWYRWLGIPRGRLIVKREGEGGGGGKEAGVHWQWQFGGTRCQPTSFDLHRIDEINKSHCVSRMRSRAPTHLYRKWKVSCIGPSSSKFFSTKRVPLIRPWEWFNHELRRRLFISMRIFLEERDLRVWRRAVVFLV